KLKVGVSWKGGEQPSDAVITQEDFVLLHGNGIDGTQLQALIASTRQSAAYKANPTPIVVNEDSTSVANLDASVAGGVSWGYLDTGQNNYLDGFQRVPVNWTINTDAKKAFFAETLKLAGPPVTVSAASVTTTATPSTTSHLAITGQARPISPPAALAAGSLLLLAGLFLLIVARRRRGHTPQIGWRNRK